MKSMTNGVRTNRETKPGVMCVSAEQWTIVKFKFLSMMRCNVRVE